MTDLNVVILEGRLTSDANVRSTSGDKNMVTFSLAVNRSFKNKEGKWSDKTSYINVVNFGLSDKLIDHLKKGVKVLVEGSLETNKKDDVTFTNVQAVRVKPLSFKKSEAGDGDGDDDLPF